ncbi:hypothetical protein EPZ47_07430 [Pseudomonas viciae]|uniref:Uncharacterized protein n=1 Tax=Pseudomonas viciae TaxID=2505979 RepID=A0A4P7PEN8_9PSED|nr:hypothetical protein EPZ47_07430 [Pseudomonas viciae]
MRWLASIVGFTDEFLIGALGRKGGTRSLPRSVLARVGIELLVPPTPSSLNIQASLLAMAPGQPALKSADPPLSRASPLPHSFDRGGFSSPG